MRSVTVQVHWLTLGSTLAPSSVALFKQLPQTETAAYQVNVTVSLPRVHLRCARGWSAVHSKSRARVSAC